MWSNSQRQEYDFHRGWSILDVTDPADPRVLKFIEGPENTGTWQVDIGDPSNPVEAGRYQPGGCAGLVDISDMSQPRLLSQFPLPQPPEGEPLDYFCTHGGRFGPHNQNQLQHNPLVKNQDDLVYLTWFNAGLRIYDISTPINPQEVGWFLPPDPRERRSPRARKRSASMWKSVRTCSAARPGASPRCGMPSQCRKWRGTRDRGVVPSVPTTLK